MPPRIYRGDPDASLIEIRATCARLNFPLCPQENSLAAYLLGIARIDPWPEFPGDAAGKIQTIGTNFEKLVRADAAKGGRGLFRAFSRLNGRLMAIKYLRGVLSRVRVWIFHGTNNVARGETCRLDEMAHQPFKGMFMPFWLRQFRKFAINSRVKSAVILLHHFDFRNSMFSSWQ